MTSGSFIGNVQQKPQRSSSSSGMIQKPPLQRALSQHYRSLPSTKKVENYIDLTLDDSELLRGRPVGSDGSATTPSRISGSRLKLEVPNNAVKFSESPNVLDRLPDSQLPPLILRGRPKLQFQGQSQLQGAKDAPLISSIRGGENITVQIPLPMPIRPGQGARCPLRERPSQISAHKKDARPKPYILEVPSTAPRYPPNGASHSICKISILTCLIGFADFFPWTGDHPEDLFTDNIIRQGYFDKIQNTQNETASAKSCIFSSLKHKSGLQTLSSLFTNVLFQRRAHGQITAAPTFKPPPRVTLTDTKREMWLRDLANPSISLRRLSRTIPHGIRGKVLLEQCLNKNIPTERAVWLAKCVGANEIRAFKRKGVTGTFPMGGEAKWIRDWTAFVEQFVEGIVASCGDKDWKSRVLYV
jgi:mediator of RNA polymerase II transcription subunit 12, fungi type